jgi:hypothetical protein
MNTTVANQSKPETAPPLAIKVRLGSCPIGGEPNRTDRRGQRKITLTLKEMFARFARFGENVSRRKRS